MNEHRLNLGSAAVARQLIEEATCFLEARFAPLKPGEVFRIEVFPPPDGLTPLSKNYTDIEKMAAYLVRHGQGSNAYVAMGIFPSRGAKRTADSVLRLDAVWADLDVGAGKAHASTEAAAAALDAFPLKPHITVSSGHGIHAYWLLEATVAGADIDRAVRIMRGLSTVLPSDPVVADAARVMRVPGTMNVDSIERRKDGLDHPVRLLEVNAELPRYRFGAFTEAGVPEIGGSSRAAAGAAQSAQPSGLPIGPRALRFVAFGAAIGQQRGEALAAARSLHGAGVPLGRAVDLVAQGLANSPQIDTSPWTHPDVEQLVKSIYLSTPPALSGEPTSPRRRERDMTSITKPEGFVFAPAAPVPNAGLFAAALYSHSERLSLVNQGSTFYAWDGTCWPEVEDATLRAALYGFFDGAEYIDADGDRKPFNPTRHKIGDLLDALAAVVHLPADVPVPSWLDREGELPASELVACTNGLVHVGSRTVLAPTPFLYVHHAVPFAFEAGAPRPARWLQFLGELWPDDAESQGTLQEIFGYIISGDTTLQKIFLLVGPKRSGKGTIARVLTALLGKHHVAGPTLAALGTNFGLSPLIGKALALVSDARLRDNESIITERLLSISGEDTLTVDRKYREPWTGMLRSRLVILSNELPRLTDSSGALASRFVLLTMTRSFYGRENPALTAELTEELPGIFNWALDGLERLRRRGHFTEPLSSADALRELEDLGSPVGAFVRDRCLVGPGYAVAVDELYRAWRRWCDDHGRDHPGTEQTFGRDLRAAVPGLRVVRPRSDDGRHRRYEGIALGTSQWAADHRGPELLVRSGPRTDVMYRREPDGQHGPLVRVGDHDDWEAL